MIVNEGMAVILEWFYAAGTRSSTLEMGLLNGSLLATDTFSSHGWTDLSADFDGRKACTFKDPSTVSNEFNLPMQSNPLTFENTSGSNKTVNGIWLTDGTVILAQNATTSQVVADGETISLAYNAGPGRYHARVTQRNEHTTTVTVNICGTGNVSRTTGDTTHIVVQANMTGGYFDGSSTKEPNQMQDGTGSGVNIDTTAWTSGFESCWRDMHPSITWPSDGAILGRLQSSGIVQLYFAEALPSDEYALNSAVWAEPLDPDGQPTEGWLPREGWLALFDGYFRTGTRPSTIYGGAIEETFDFLHERNNWGDTDWSEHATPSRASIDFDPSTGSSVQATTVGDGTPAKLPDSSTEYTPGGIFLIDSSSGTGTLLVVGTDTSALAGSPIATTHDLSVEGTIGS